MKNVIVLFVWMIAATGHCIAQTNQFTTGVYPALVPRSKAPVVSLDEAIILANEFIKTKGVNTNGFWMREVRLIYPDGKHATPMRWHLWWVHEDGSLGHDISIMVDMEKRVWKMPSM